MQRELDMPYTYSLYFLCFPCVSQRDNRDRHIHTIIETHTRKVREGIEKSKGISNLRCIPNSFSLSIASSSSSSRLTKEREKKKRYFLDMLSFCGKRRKTAPGLLSLSLFKTDSWCRRHPFRSHLPMIPSSPLLFIYSLRWEVQMVSLISFFSLWIPGL